MTTPLKLEQADQFFKAPDLTENENPKGFEEVQTLFCDSSGMGGGGERALTMEQATEAVTEAMEEFPELYAGITGIGQFQVYVTLYKKAGMEKKAVKKKKAGKKEKVSFMTTTVNDLIEVYKIAQPGGHWFDEDTMSFFKTSLGATAYILDGITYFITGEQAPNSRRKYTVRSMDLHGEIETITDFNTMTLKAAEKHLAGILGCSVDSL